MTLRLPPLAARPQAARSRLGAVGVVLRAAPSLAPFLGGVLLVSAAMSGAWSFIGLRIVQQGGGPFLVGLAAGLTAFVEIPVMRRTGALGRRFGLPAVYVAGAAVYASVFLVWAVVRDPLVISIVPAPTASGSRPGARPGRRLEHRTRPGRVHGGVVFARLGAPVLFAGCAALSLVGAAIVWRVLAGSLEVRDTGS